MSCYCIADTKTKKFLSVNDTWVSFEDGMRDDSVRGYMADTESMKNLTADLEKFGGESRAHPSPDGVTIPLFYDWGC